MDNGGIGGWSKRQLRARGQRVHGCCEPIDLTSSGVEGSTLLLILRRQTLRNPILMQTIAQVQGEHGQSRTCSDPLAKHYSRLSVKSLHNGSWTVRIKGRD